MREYHKINTIFKRDMETREKPLVWGEWSTPEFEYLAENDWEFTEKVDGTNIRVMWDGENVSFGGKTDRAQLPVKLFERLTRHFTADKFASLDPGMCMYGEGYGKGIQGCGGLYSDEQEFVAFDVLYGTTWLKQADVADIASKLGVPSVPVVGTGTLYDAIAMVRAGMDSEWGDFLSEGVVARPRVELLNRLGHRIIAKIKHKDFSNVVYRTSITTEEVE